MPSQDALNGQWMGRFAGTDCGDLHINIDEDGSFYRGVAYLFSDDARLPRAVAYFSIPGKGPEFSFRTEIIRAIDPETSNAVPWKTIQPKFPEGTFFSEHAEVQGSCEKDVLELSWTTDIGVTGQCKLPRSKADQPSELVPLAKNWDQYREYVIELASKRLLFRGQNGQWRLRTRFHRSGRADMHRFVFQDIPALHRHLSARTRHVFKLGDEEEFGAFLNLIQHHGYPTPILDWTYSPYVAAFFAYRGITNEQASRAAEDARVRVYVFDSKVWSGTYQPVSLLVHPQLHVTVREFIAIENERMIPQQAASTVTSVDDIESYVRGRETQETKYLQAIDLPVRERRRVVSELSFMGITAGSLFPGLDGACEELAERNFEGLVL